MILFAVQKKLFDVNSHSIDDVEAELNGKTKTEIVKLFFECFDKNGNAEHFKKFWTEPGIYETTER